MNVQCIEVGLEISHVLESFVKSPHAGIYALLSKCRVFSQHRGVYILEVAYDIVEAQNTRKETIVVEVVGVAAFRLGFVLGVMM